jgi:NAD+ synthase (glutamine-hydrolysing)
MVKIALAQLNLVVGDISGNKKRIASAMDRALEEGAQVLAVPELAITGYPPEDLVLKRSFVTANKAAVADLAGRCGDLLTVLGFVDEVGGVLYNAAAICHDGGVLATYHKHVLPNYGVFDERRYFSSGRGHHLVDTTEGVIGVCICEDSWIPDGPLVTQGDAGAQIVVNINASPYHKGKSQEREQMLCERARRAASSIVYVNQVGGQDELVFDGGSLVIDPDGGVLARSPQFHEDFQIVEVPLGTAGSAAGGSVDRVSVTLRSGKSPAQGAIGARCGKVEEVYEALRLAVHDYVRKNGFSKVVVGSSGGIDSALTTVIASDALGPENVSTVAMPSGFSSSHSLEDARLLAANLGVEMLEIPIRAPYESYLALLESTFGAVPMGLAEENLQARIRGNLLMAISNRYGHLVLATGNKSELACGYATLYGDMAGGFALLKDVFKTEVYELCRYRNSVSEVIPRRIIDKAPSAELRPDQKDSDSLPPYDVLDPILEAYIEDDASIEDIAAAGADRSTVERVAGLVDRTEYKRRQAAPGPKVTVKAFGRDRRLPITNGWRESQGPPTPV